MSRPSLVVVVIVVLAFAFSTPLLATESRIVGGDGLIGDSTIASSIWTIGLCPIVPGQDYGYHVAETANAVWPGAFAEYGAFRIVTVPDVNPSALTPDDIVRLGEEYGVDALVWGSVDQAKNRRSPWGSWSNPQNDVAVMISFDLYETQTGTLLWERTLKKDRTVPTSEAEGIVERFAGNIVTDMVAYLVADGIAGRDLSLNSPPVIVLSQPSLVFRTSAACLSGTVTDDFGVDEVSISCGADEAIRQWTAVDEQEFVLDVVIDRTEIAGDCLTILARDSQGQETQLRLPLDLSQPQIEAIISNVTADTVFINEGSIGGVELGMVFTVETTVEIIDPSTGSLLGSSCLETGMIEVVSVDSRFAACSVVEGAIEDIEVGDRVY